MFLPIKFLLNTFEVTPATGFIQFDSTDILDSATTVVDCALAVVDCATCAPADIVDSATTQVVETGYDYDVDRYSWDY